jgi:hypothetical protein
MTHYEGAQAGAAAEAVLLGARSLASGSRWVPELGRETGQLSQIVPP